METQIAARAYTLAELDTLRDARTRQQFNNRRERMDPAIVASLVEAMVRTDMMAGIDPAELAAQQDAIDAEWDALRAHNTTKRHEEIDRLMSGGMEQKEAGLRTAGGNYPGHKLHPSGLGHP